MSSTGITIEGLVQQPVTVGYDDLAALPGQVADVGSVVPGREGTAVRLGDLLAKAGPTGEATHLTIEADDASFSASIPLATVDSAVIVYRLDGAPLPREKGGPFRLLIPDAKRCHDPAADKCANVKFVARLRLDAGPGHDTRPTTKDEHARLHEQPGHEHSK